MTGNREITENGRRTGGKDFSGFGDASFTPVDKRICREGSRETVSFRFSLPDKVLAEIKLTHYYSHGATEWTVYFSNPTDRNSAVLEQPETIMDFPGDRPVLKGIQGDHEGYYAPMKGIFPTAVRRTFCPTAAEPRMCTFPISILASEIKALLSPSAGPAPGKPPSPEPDRVSVTGPVRSTACAPF